MSCEIYIDDGNFQEHVDVVLDGTPRSRGLVLRNYDTHPLGYLSVAPFKAFPSIPREEWSDRIKQMESSKSRLSDVRNTGAFGQRIQSRDQNGRGYCWAHSSTSAMLLDRARDHQPYADLSAYAVACIIKGYRDQGGWGSESLEFITNRGIPTSEFWPQQSVSRSNDNANTWANAALHKAVKAWMDLQTGSLDVLFTLLFNRIPGVVDYNWWGHSVCAADPVEVDASKSLNDPNRWGVRIWNSWGDSWSEAGMGVLVGRKAIPDGLVAPFVTLPSLI